MKAGDLAGLTRRVRLLEDDAGASWSADLSVLSDSELYELMALDLRIMESAEREAVVSEAERARYHEIRAKCPRVRCDPPPSFLTGEESLELLRFEVLAEDARHVLSDDDEERRALLWLRFSGDSR